MRAIDKRIPTSYASAEALIGTRERIRVAANTEIVRITPDTIGVSLHGTIVVAFMRDGSIALNSGGYRTATTKARINSALRETMFRLHQRAGAWLLYVIGTNAQLDITFFDGITVKA